jgi:aldose 1-epimerase
VTTAGADHAVPPPGGRPVVLRAGDAVLTIDPEAGARFSSLIVEGHERLVTEGAGPIDWGCYPMAPFAGRIGDGRFTFRGRSYQLETNLPPNAIHGTVFDRPWRVLVRESDNAVFETDLGPGWPFAGRVRQRIALAPVALEAHLELVADEPMPAWLGWHPWFRRRLDGGGAPVRLEASAGRMYERGADRLPTGRLVDPTPGPWDDAFTALDGRARLTWPGSLSLEIESTAPVRVLFDERPYAICIEPQTAPPDAIRLADLAGSEPPIAEPGRPLSVAMGWYWTQDGGAVEADG